MYLSYTRPARTTDKPSEEARPSGTSGLSSPGQLVEGAAVVIVTLDQTAAGEPLVVLTGTTRPF